jgi:hypothetical protein
MSSSVVGQLLINHIHKKEIGFLPEDICEEIKSCCFYESVTGKTRILKKEILRNIENSTSCANCPQLFDSSGINEFFLFRAGCHEGWPDSKIIQLQITFCPTCGNYCDYSTFDGYLFASPKVKCVCPHQDFNPNLLWLNANFPEPDLLFD